MSSNIQIVKRTETQMTMDDFFNLLQRKALKRFDMTDKYGATYAVTVERIGDVEVDDGDQVIGFTGQVNTGMYIHANLMVINGKVRLIVNSNNRSEAKPSEAVKSIFPVLISIGDADVQTGGKRKITKRKVSNRK